MESSVLSAWLSKAVRAQLTMTLRELWVQLLFQGSGFWQLLPPHISVLQTMKVISFCRHFWMLSFKMSATAAAHLRAFRLFGMWTRTWNVACCVLALFWGLLHQGKSTKHWLASVQTTDINRSLRPDDVRIYWSINPRPPPPQNPCEAWIADCDHLSFL